MREWKRLSDIHLWDLTVNSTRFEQASAAPSDDNLYTQWTGTATIAAIVAFFTFLLMISILRVPSVRNKSFNCYILAVVWPDFQLSLSCSITCTVNAINGYYHSEAMCGWQTWYSVFGFTASCWMNAVFSDQVYTMLRVSHVRRRYDPPTTRKVAQQTMCVYAYGACLASLAVWNVLGVPFKGGIYQGYGCLPKDYDDASTIFFWLVSVQRSHCFIDLCSAAFTRVILGSHIIQPPHFSKGFLPASVLIPLAYVFFLHHTYLSRGDAPARGSAIDNMDVFFAHIRLRGDVAALHLNYVRLGPRFSRGQFHLGLMERFTICSLAGPRERVDDPVQAGYTCLLSRDDYVLEVAWFLEGGKKVAGFRAGFTYTFAFEFENGQYLKES